MNQAPSRPAHTPRALSLAFFLTTGGALFLGGTDVLLALPGKPDFLASPSVAAAIIAVTAGASALALLAVSAATLCLGALLRRHKTPSLLVAAHCLVISAVLWVQVLNVKTEAGLQAQSTKLLTVLGVSLLLAFIAWRVFREPDRPERFQRLRTIGLAIAWITLACAAVLWLCLYHFPFAFIYAMAMLVPAAAVACLVAMAVSRLMRGFAGPATLNAAAGLCLAIAAYPAIAAKAVLPPRTETSARADHSIRHIVLVTVDSLRRDALGCYGGVSPATPRLDAFAKENLLFTNAYSPAPWTEPALASILSGLSPLVHDFPGESKILQHGVVTLAERLADQGYATCGVWHNPIIPSSTQLSQGFQRRYSFPQYQEWDDDSGTLGAKLLKKTIWKGPYSVEGNTKELTDIACAWVQANKTNDFFLWLHYFDPHWPFTPPKRYLPESPLLDEFGAGFKSYNSAMKGFDVTNSRKREWTKLLYDAEVAYVDENFGRLMDCLKELGIYDNALVILTNDHGEEFWEHGHFGHAQSVYNELIAAPLALKLPENASPKTIEAYVSTGSITPTILDLLKTPADPASLSYPSLAPLLAGDGPVPFHGNVTSASVIRFEELESVAWEGRKFITSLTTGREWIFDQDRDPGELAPLTDPESSLRQEGMKRIEEHRATSRELQTRYGIIPSQPGAGPKRDERHDDAPSQEKNKQLETLGYL
ncbi:MAG TPA: sulfatase-like hydrolase/transferase [Candidatus Hydrogenedentes bacterium]|nr:sulfatase-like hydrolase/transferase [Candidatus Hydrogenedentota bacterium]HOS03008.1 sulfatase-like hydrolase/transferase [Candidatus Hydrogenedentota bacterium]